MTDAPRAREDLSTTRIDCCVHLVGKTAINVQMKVPVLNVWNRQYPIRLEVVENVAKGPISKTAGVSGAA